MKKILTMLGMFLVVLAGCGSTNAEADVSIDADRVQEANLDVWMPAGKNTDWFTEAVDDYNTEFGTNITLTFTDVAPADVVAKATPMLSAKQEMPELMLIQDQNFNDIYSVFPDEFIDLSAYGLGDDYWSNYAPNKLTMMSDLTGGDLYGFPTDFAPTVVYYREDLFEQVGIDYDNDINSMQDLIDAGEKIYDETGVQMFGLSAPADSSFYNIMLQMQGQQYYSNGKFNFDTEEAKKAAEYTVQVAQSDATGQYVTSDLAGSTEQNSSIVLEGSWWGGTNERDNPDDAGNWRIGTLPPFEEGMDQVVPVNGGSAVYVSKHSDQAQAALQVAAYAYGEPEVAGKAIDYGISTANTAAYDTEYGGKENAYYGGQKVSQIYESNFDKINTNVNYELSNATILKIIGAEIGKAADGSQTIDEALAAIQKQCEMTVEVPEE